MKPRVLLTGKNGQVGSELQRLLGNSSELRALDRQELDLSNSKDIRDAIRRFHPHIIINAAAYTAVDRAESEQAAARIVNADAPTVMAEEAKAIGAALIHYSTDYVFDGSKRSPYREDDPPCPISVYGESKLAGEQGIQNVGGAYLIFRTEWVYALRGKNFLCTIARLASQQEQLRIVADQRGAPTWSREIAIATAKIVSKEWRRSNGVSPFAACSGIYHMTASGQASWYEFATAIVDEARRIPPDSVWLKETTSGRPLVVQRIVPIATADYPTPARRPSYSVLSNARLEKTFDVRLPDWRLQLHSAVAAG